ncbi:MAG: HAD family hydrolase [Nanoarchaeota archaeon]
MLQGVLKVGFDIDGTLYQRTAEIDNRVQTEIAKRILQKRPELGSVRSALAFFQTEYATGRKGGGTVLKEVGYADSSKVMDDCIATADVLDLIQRDEPLVQMVHGLASKYSLFVVTSNPRQIAVKKLDRLGFNGAACFEFLVCSEQGDKRTGEAFRRALQYSSKGTAPHHHLYVGDSPGADIEPASAVGMRTVIIDPQTQTNTYQQLRTINDLRSIL